MKLQAGPHQSESFIYKNQQLDIAQIVIKISKRCFTMDYYLAKPPVHLIDHSVDKCEELSAERKKADPKVQKSISCMTAPALCSHD